MAALNERKVAVLRTMVQAWPDKMIGGVRQALAGKEADPVLGAVLRLVEIESRDRLLRNLVLKVVAPLFVGDGRTTDRLTFPVAALPTLWRGVKAVAPRLTADVDIVLERLLIGDHPADMLDGLTAAAAAGLRDLSNHEFQAASDLCEQARPGSAAALACCLDLAPLTRHTIGKAAYWISHMDEDTVAAARVAYRDATALGADAGLYFFEMLAAQLPQPWMVLRLISAVMDHPTERLLSDSELRGFAERTMVAVDHGLAAFAAFDPDAGPDAARAAGHTVDVATRQISEVEANLNLNRDQGWGARVHKQRMALAAAVEVRLRATELATAAALPTQSAKISRIRRQAPLMSVAPDAILVTRALNLLTFSDEIRTSANYGGFGAARGKMVDKLNAMLDLYVEDAVEQVRAHQAEGEAAKVWLGVVADIMALVRDAASADVVRRRGAAIAHAESLVTPATQAR